MSPARPNTTVVESQPCLRSESLINHSSANRYYLAAIAAVLAIMTLVGCRSGSDIDISTLAAGSDQKLWEAAQKELTKKRYDNARKYLNRLIEGFPQSQHQTDARLAVADSYFQEGSTSSLLMAAAEYRDFASLYPSNPKASYAQLQVAESFYREINPPDRDQTQTKQALDEYLRFLQLYPSAPEVPKVRERIQELTDHLAKADYLVGYFYQKTRRAYRAAVLRYQDILSDYPAYSHMDDVLFRLGQCFLDSGLPAEAAPQLDKLIRDYPESPHVKDATHLLEDARSQIPTAAPPEPPQAAAKAPGDAS
jgi:outer membrane protein assembly factor BamD